MDEKEEEKREWTRMDAETSSFESSRWKEKRKRSFIGGGGGRWSRYIQG